MRKKKGIRNEFFGIFEHETHVLGRPATYPLTRVGSVLNDRRVLCDAEIECNFLEMSEQSFILEKIFYFLRKAHY